MFQYLKYYSTLFSAIYLVPGFTCKQYAYGQWCIVGQQLNHFCVQTKQYIVYTHGIDNYSSKHQSQLQQVAFIFIFFMPLPFSMGGHIVCRCHFQWGIYSIIRPSIPPVLYVCNTDGFHAISFEKIGILDSNFIHRYIIIKCRSSSIYGKFHQLFWELWPFLSFEKWFPFHNF